LILPRNGHAHLLLSWSYLLIQARNLVELPELLKKKVLIQASGEKKIKERICYKQ
jgi:hypothetical protein